MPSCYKNKLRRQTRSTTTTKKSPRLNKRKSTIARANTRPRRSIYIDLVEESAESSLSRNEVENVNVSANETVSANDDDRSESPFALLIQAIDQTQEAIFNDPNGYDPYKHNFMLHNRHNNDNDDGEQNVAADDEQESAVVTVQCDACGKQYQGKKTAMNAVMKRHKKDFCVKLVPEYAQMVEHREKIDEHRAMHRQNGIRCERCGGVYRNIGAHHPSCRPKYHQVGDKHVSSLAQVDDVDTTTATTIIERNLSSIDVRKDDEIYQLAHRAKRQRREESLQNVDNDEFKLPAWAIFYFGQQAFDKDSPEWSVAVRRDRIPHDTKLYERIVSGEFRAVNNGYIIELSIENIPENKVVWAKCLLATAFKKIFECLSHARPFTPTGDFHLDYTIHRLALDLGVNEYINTVSLFDGTFSMTFRLDRDYVVEVVVGQGLKIASDDGESTNNVVTVPLAKDMRSIGGEGEGGAGGGQFTITTGISVYRWCGDGGNYMQKVHECIRDVYFDDSCYDKKSGRHCRIALPIAPLNLSALKKHYDNTNIVISWPFDMRGLAEPMHEANNAIDVEMIHDNFAFATGKAQLSRTDLLGEVRVYNANGIDVGYAIVQQ